MCPVPNAAAQMALKSSPGERSVALPEPNVQGHHHHKS